MLAGLVFPRSAGGAPGRSGSRAAAPGAGEVKARVRRKADGIFDRLVSGYIEARDKFRENKERARRCHLSVRDQLRGGPAGGRDLPDRARGVRRTIARPDVCRPAPRRRR